MRVKIVNSYRGPGNGQSVLKDRCCVEHNPLGLDLGRLRVPGLGQAIEAMMVGITRKILTPSAAELNLRPLVQGLVL